MFWTLHLHVQSAFDVFIGAKSSCAHFLRFLLLGICVCTKGVSLLGTIQDPKPKDSVLGKVIISWNVTFDECLTSALGTIVLPCPSTTPIFQPSSPSALVKPLVSKRESFDSCDLLCIDGESDLSFGFYKIEHCLLSWSSALFFSTSLLILRCYCVLRYLELLSLFELLFDWLFGFNIGGWHRHSMLLATFSCFGRVVLVSGFCINDRLLLLLTMAK